jgi:fatty acid desaturase
MSDMLPYRHSDAHELSVQALSAETEASRQFKRMVRLIRWMFFFLVGMTLIVFAVSGIWQDVAIIVLMGVLALMTVQMMKVLYALMFALAQARKLITYLEETRD